MLRLHMALTAILVCFCALNNTASAQPASSNDASTGSISGIVLNAATREPIPAANVVLLGQNRGASADMDGRFQISNFPPGSYHLTASALGYESQTISEIAVRTGRSVEVEFLLRPSSVQAEEVTFTVNLFESPSSDLPTSTRSLRYEEIRRAPGGLEDVQRTLQALPGVVGANDQSNQIVVRGGSPEENLTIIDGLEVDNTNHFTTAGEGNGGAINALNTEFLKDVTFSSGGFSARYGDRLSSVLALELREGNPDRFGGTADFNMGGAGGHVEGPIGENGSYLASVHRSFLELLPGDAVGSATVPWYWSTQARVHQQLTDNHQVTVNALYLHDEQSVEPEDTFEEIEENGESYNTQFDGFDYSSRRYAAGARVRSLWGLGFTDVIVGRSWNRRDTDVFDADEQPTGGYDERLVHSEQQTLTNDQLHVHWNGRGINRDDWGAGISLKPARFEYELFNDGDSIIYDDGFLDAGDGSPDTFRYTDQLKTVDETALKSAAYLQYSWRPATVLTFTGGVRMDHVDVSDEALVSPRLSANWRLLPSWTLSLAWGQYAQAQDIGIYLDPGANGANESLPYAKASHYVTGLSFLPRSSTLISVEGYFKDYDNLLVREEDILRERTGDDRIESDRYLARKTKEAWGVEVFLHQKLVANWYGTLSYAYGQSEATDPAFGTYPSDFDYRHVATAVIGYNTTLIQHKWYRDALRDPWFYWLWLIPVHGDQLSISSRFRHMSGRPYTDQVWIEEAVPSREPIYESHWEDQEHNGARFPDYQRWDIRIDNTYQYGSRALVFYLEVQNIADRINVADYFYQDDGTRDTIEQFRQLWIAGVRYEF